MKTITLNENDYVTLTAVIQQTLITLPTEHENLRPRIEELQDVVDPEFSKFLRG